MGGLEHHRVYEFGGFRLDTAQRLLFGPDGERVELTSRAFDTLLFMVEHPGELLDTDRLMKAVWPNLIVEENSLQQIITALRRALGEKPDDHKFIVTSRGQGYRFVAPVAAAGPSAAKALPTGPGTPNWRRSSLWAGGLLVLGLLAALIVYFPARMEGGPDRNSVAVTAVPSIAVLPFDDLSPDGDQAYFSRGISDELLTQLAQLKGLRVAGSASSSSVVQLHMDARAIGEKLGVGHILQGSVRKDGDLLRISARLVSTGNGYQLWSKTFERQTGDVFAVQGEIARAVAGALSIALKIDTRNRLPGTGTRNFEAYDNYLAAVDIVGSGGDVSQAIVHIDRALRLDPNYAAAWAALSVSYGVSAFGNAVGGVDNALQKMGEAATRAVELDPDLADGHFVLGNYLTYESQWAEAERELKKAIGLSERPYTYGAYAIYMGRVGRIEAAKVYADTSQERDRLNPVAFFWSGMLETAQGHFKKASDDIDRSEELGGTVLTEVNPHLFIALSEGDTQEIRKWLEVAAAAGTSEASLLQSVLKDFDAPDLALADLRTAYAAARYHEHGPPNTIGLLAAYFGDPRFALEVWSDELKQNKARMLYIWFPVFSEMRKLPEFKSLVRELKLVDYWRTSGWPDVCEPVGDHDFSCH